MYVLKGFNCRLETATGEAILLSEDQARALFSLICEQLILPKTLELVPRNRHEATTAELQIYLEGNQGLLSVAFTGYEVGNGNRWANEYLGWMLMIIRRYLRDELRPESGRVGVLLISTNGARVCTTEEDALDFTRKLVLYQQGLDRVVEKIAVLAALEAEIGEVPQENMLALTSQVVHRHGMLFGEQSEVLFKVIDRDLLEAADPFAARAVVSRTINVMSKLGITTYQSLMGKAPKDILAMSKSGKAVLTLLRKLLADQGLKFACEY